MMQGLLDFAKSPAGVGLLSAVAGGLAGARRGAPLNTIGAAGLAGLTGYNAASSIQEKQLERAQAEKVRQAIPAMYKRKDDGSMQFDVQGAIDSGLFTPEQIKSYAEVPNYGRAKVARTVEVAGPGGVKQIQQFDDYGNPVGQGLDGYVAPQMVDTGDRKMFVTPTAGQTFNVGLSPAEILANQRGQASLALRDQNNRLLQDANDIQRTATRTELFKASDGTTYRVDRGTGQVSALTTPDGKPLKSESGNTLTESEGKNTLYLSQMVDAENALKNVPGTVSPIAVAATNTPYANWAVPADAQKAAQSQRQWAEAYLRAKTGAAATQGEVDNNIRTFFPVVGDSDEVIQRKAEARAQAMEDMRIPAGRGAARVEKPRATSGSPAAGAVVDGYRFKGGNPNDPSNWEAQ